MILDYFVVEFFFFFCELLIGFFFENFKFYFLCIVFVNVDILGFLVMEWVIEEERYNVEVIFFDFIFNLYFFFL